MPGVKRDRDGSVGLLTLDEPETLNAMTPDLLGALTRRRCLEASFRACQMHVRFLDHHSRGYIVEYNESSI